MFKLSFIDEDSFDVYLNGVYIINANYDSDGSHGMRTIRNMVERIAKELGIEVFEEFA